MSSSPMTATFAIKIQDDTSGAAGNASKALEDLQAKIVGDTKALAAMQAAMRNLKGGTTTNIAAFRELRDKITAQKASIAESQAKYVELGGVFGQLPAKINPVEQAVTTASKSVEDFSGTIGMVPGPLGGMVSRLSSLRSILTGGGGLVLGLALSAAALIGLVAALASATAALVSYGVASSNARREEALRLEGLTLLRRSQIGGAGTAADIQAAIDQVSASSSLSRGKIEEYATSLYRMRLRGQDLTTALQAMATTGAVQGDQYAQMFAYQAGGARMAGRSVDDLAARVERRLGGTAQRQALGLNVQIDKLHENFARITDGLNLDRLLSGFHTVTELFSQNTASGQALKHMFESMFQPLIDGAGGAAPLVKRFIQGMILAALDFEQIVLELEIAWMEAFPSQGTANANAAFTALDLGRFVVGGLLGVTLALGAAVGLLVAPFVIISRKVLDFVAFVEYAIGELDGFGDRMKSIGTDLVRGLVRGITTAGPEVGAAILGIGSNMISALRGALGIHSPSRVFAELGRQIPAGLEVGIDAGSAGADAAASSIVTPPSLGSGSGGGRSVSISIGDVIINGGGDPASNARAFRDELAAILEGIAIQQGAPS